MITFDVVNPIIRDIYGDSPMAAALVALLAEDIIDGGGVPYRSYRTRENRILQACWNMFPGGDTAEIAANRIEAALVEAGI